MRGYVQVYTGNGKGKTTAALGLSLRAAGAGLKVFFGQFLKKGSFSEHLALKKYSDTITVEQFATPGFIIGEPTAEDRAAAESGMARIEAVVKSGDFDVVVIDEINVATHYGLVDSDRVVSMIGSKPDDVELVLTGRYAHDDVIGAANLVTEMRAVKHYHDAGVSARVGIER